MELLSSPPPVPEIQTSGEQESPSCLSQPLYRAGFLQAQGRFFRKYAVFTGRASPREYWLAVLGQVLMGLMWVAVVLIPPLFMPAELVDSTHWPLFSWAVPGLLLSVVLAVPNMALTVRRLHDAGLSGWWMLLGWIPSVGPFILLTLVSRPPVPEGRRFDARPPTRQP